MRDLSAFPKKMYFWTRNLVLLYFQLAQDQQIFPIPVLQTVSIYGAFIYLFPAGWCSGINKIRAWFSTDDGMVLHLFLSCQQWQHVEAKDQKALLPAFGTEKSVGMFGVLCKITEKPRGSSTCGHHRNCQRTVNSVHFRTNNIKIHS
jgi:hypothetical protein